MLEGEKERKKETPFNCNGIRWPLFYTNTSILIHDSEQPNQEYIQITGRIYTNPIRYKLSGAAGTLKLVELRIVVLILSFQTRKKMIKVEKQWRRRKNV